MKCGGGGSGGGGRSRFGVVVVVRSVGCGGCDDMVGDREIK